MKPDQLRRHFAETAKKMILENGVESVSVRKIAAQAGYAYASIYNHFRNLEELLWYSRSLIINAFAASLADAKSSSEGGPEALKGTFRNYLRWFLEHPHAYRFLYFHQLDRGSKTTDSLADSPEFENQRAASFAFLADAGWTRSARELFGRTLIHAAQGMLTLAVTGNDITDTDGIYREMDELIDFMILKEERNSWKGTDSTKKSRR